MSVARGEEVFNTTKIKIKGVTGLNDVLNMPVIDGFCGTCHDSPNVGNHSAAEHREAATLLDVVNFYDQRFDLNFTDQQKQDLVNFLNAL